MSDNTEQPVQQVTQALEKVLDTGSRCDLCAHCNRADHVGQLTAGRSIKMRWHQTDMRKSLKQFARELATSGDQSAKDWFAHKKGSLNQDRSEKNRARIALERQASKAARRKKKPGQKAEAPAAPVAK